MQMQTLITHYSYWSSRPNSTSCGTCNADRAFTVG